tara:strand:+ start:1190 stop:1393 length:204 start_codon:yes stop_codon:yes gene_type:complete
MSFLLLAAFWLACASISYFILMRHVNKKITSKEIDKSDRILFFALCALMGPAGLIVSLILTIAGDVQ